MQALLELARQAKKPDWWLPYRGALSTELRSFLGLEEAATGIREFASHGEFDWRFATTRTTTC